MIIAERLRMIADASERNPLFLPEWCKELRDAADEIERLQIACAAALPILEYRHRKGDDTNDPIKNAYQLVCEAVPFAKADYGDVGGSS